MIAKISVNLVSERLESASELFGFEIDTWVKICVHILPEIYADPSKVDDPSKHPPGSDKKIEVLQSRLSGNKLLWNKSDSAHKEKKPEQPKGVRFNLGDE